MISHIKIILKDNLLSAIVKEYKFDSVQAFYKELNAAEKEQIVKEREAGRDNQARQKDKGAR